MPRRSKTTAPSDTPKIDLAGSYLKYLRLREIVQNAEQRRDPKKPSATTLSAKIGRTRTAQRSP